MPVSSTSPDARWRWARTSSRIPRPGDICADALRPHWSRRPEIDQLGILLADLFYMIGDCRLTFCAGPKVASHLFVWWGSIADLRKAQNSWPRPSDGPTLMEYVEIVRRNVHCARIRPTLEFRRGQMGSESESRDAAGNIIYEPSDDELLRLVSGESFLSRHSFPVKKLKWSTVPNPIRAQP